LERASAAHIADPDSIPANQKWINIAERKRFWRYDLGQFLVAQKLPIEKIVQIWSKEELDDEFIKEELADDYSKEELEEIAKIHAQKNTQKKS